MNVEGKILLGKFQDGEVEAYWTPEHKAVHFVDADTKLSIGPTVHFMPTDNQAYALYYAEKYLGKIDPIEKEVV